MKYLISALFIFYSTLSCQTNSQPTQIKGNNGVLWLKDIKRTGRISSNHYSDFVLDGKGSVYISCFETQEDRNDEIRIFKIDTKGDLKWEIGKGNRGRATTIDISPSGEIWVGGFYEDQIKIGSKSSNYSPGQHPFLAQIDEEGNCINLINGKGNGIIYNLRTGNDGSIWASGEGSDGMQFGDQRLKMLPDKGSGFLTSFSSKANCLWINQIGGSIVQLYPLPSGELIVCGSFYSSFFYEGQEMQTRGNFDSDAFLIKVNEQGGLVWNKKFGNEGYTRKGYRSWETGIGLLDNDDGSLDFLFTQESKDSINHSLHSIYSLELDPNGNVQNTQEIISGLRRGSAISINRTETGNTWIGFSLDNKSNPDRKHFSKAKESPGTIGFWDENWQLQKSWSSSLQSDAMYRVIRSMGKEVYISGHYRHQLVLGDIELNSGEDHHLFLLKMEE